MLCHVKLTLQRQGVDIPHDLNDHHAYPHPLGRQVGMHARMRTHTHTHTKPPLI